MVSLGDTAISLHILQPPLTVGGGVFWKVKSQSAKICLNFNIRGWVGGGQVLVLESQKPKCQDLPKFQLGGGGRVLESQNPKCQDLPKFQFQGGWGEGCSA